MSVVFFPPEIKSRNVTHILKWICKTPDLTWANFLPKKRLTMWDIFFPQVKGGSSRLPLGETGAKFMQQKPKTPAAGSIVILYLLCTLLFTEGRSAEAFLQEWKRVFEKGEAMRENIGLEKAISCAVKCFELVSAFFFCKRNFEKILRESYVIGSTAGTIIWKVAELWYKNLWLLLENRSFIFWNN